MAAAGGGAVAPTATASFSPAGGAAGGWLAAAGTAVALAGRLAASSWADGEIGGAVKGQGVGRQRSWKF